MFTGILGLLLFSPLVYSTLEHYDFSFSLFLQETMGKERVC